MGNQDLGICFQIGKERGLQKRVQKKHMPQIIKFEAFLPENRNFYPLGSDMPFPQLDQLLSMAFAVENGIPGLVLKTKG